MDYIPRNSTPICRSNYTYTWLYRVETTSASHYFKYIKVLTVKQSCNSALCQLFKHNSVQTRRARRQCNPPPESSCSSQLQHEWEPPSDTADMNVCIWVGVFLWNKWGGKEGERERERVRERDWVRKIKCKTRTHTVIDAKHHSYTALRCIFGLCWSPQLN